jgi:alkylhydroperoxidase family enzyme
MARLQYLDPEGVIADRVRDRRGGRLRPLDQVLMHSPAMAAGWNTFLGAVRGETLLSDDVREIVILRIAVLNTARYEWIAHVPLAVEAGLNAAQLAHLERPVSPSPLTGPQQHRDRSEVAEVGAVA